MVDLPLYLDIFSFRYLKMLTLRIALLLQWRPTEALETVKAGDVLVK